jgi:hypothetical protein
MLKNFELRPITTLPPSMFYASTHCCFSCSRRTYPLKALDLRARQVLKANCGCTAIECASMALALPNTCPEVLVYTSIIWSFHVCQALVLHLHVSFKFLDSCPLFHLLSSPSINVRSDDPDKTIPKIVSIPK